MTILTIHPANSDQVTAVRFFLHALHIDYKTGEDMDETAYLKSSPAMVEQMDNAMNEEQPGEGITISLYEIWK